MAEREPYLYQFDDIFWLTVSGSLFAFLAVAIKACLKSNCTKIKFLGFECTREPTEGEPDTEDLELQLPPGFQNRLQNFITVHHAIYRVTELQLFSGLGLKKF